MKKQQIPFVLASSSPQRMRLVEQIGIHAKILPVEIEEDHDQGSDAAELVQILAREKLEKRLMTIASPVGQETMPDPGDAVILAADTIVALDHHRLGKPVDRRQAGEFLKALSDRTHEVLTAQALYIPHRIRPDIQKMSGDGLPAFTTIAPSELGNLPRGYGENGIIVMSTAVTRISLKALDDGEIEDYLSWEQWRGAAGGYRVQGRAGCFLDEMSGSYTNVVGLPIEVLYGILRRTSFWVDS